MMKLYGFPPSPNTWKVRAVAAHLGIPLELVLVDLSKGEQRKPDYLAINASGRTPTLAVGDFVLTESNAIMQYLANQNPNSLWPNDARARAKITSWQCWQLAHWGSDACVPLVFQRLVKKLLNLGPPDEAAVAKATDVYNREAKLLEAHLAKQPYLVGKEPTLADFSVAASLLYVEQAELPIEPYARVQEWFARVSALPCWKETAPQFSAAVAA
jgi:glutathione S-transferase